MYVDRYHRSDRTTRVRWAALVIDAVLGCCSACFHLRPISESFYFIVIIIINIFKVA